MENQQQTKLEPGAWAHMTARENKEQVKWPEIDVSHTLTFVDDAPQELTGKDGGIFYKFNVVEGEAEKVVLTSAFSLLRGIKGLGEPLKGRSGVITKRSVGGKQWYEVVEWSKETPTEKVE